MISLEPIEKLISLALYSAYIKDEKPLSLLLVSKVEAGKTMLLEKFSCNQGCEWLGDATAWGIAKHYGKRIREGKIRHLLFPELSIPTSRNRDTVSAFDAYLCGLIEEGVGRIASFRYGEVSTNAPMGCGIIGCISKQDFDAKQNSWFRIGLMSRLLPVSYNYTERTRKRIMLYTKMRSYRTEQRIKLPLPNPSKLVEIDLPLRLANNLEKLSQNLTTGTELYGFRFQRHLQRLAMANALSRGDTTVTKDDVRVVEGLTQYLNTESTAEV